jgi:hypothetical protein
MRWICSIIVVLLITSTAAVLSQEKTPARATEPPVPEVSEADKQVLIQLQTIGNGFSMSIAVLQEKLDSANAEKARQFARIQAQFPGYELTPALTLVRKTVK